MMKDFVVLEGSQALEGNASIGLYKVGEDDGGWANFAVGLPGARYSYRLSINEQIDVPGLGSLTLVAVHLGETKGKRGALFSLTTI